MNKSIRFLGFATLILMCGFAFTASAHSQDRYEKVRNHGSRNSGTRSDFHVSGLGSTTGVGGLSSGSTPTSAAATTSIGKIRFEAYNTLYAAGDNTPAGSIQIDLGGYSGNAGGTGPRGVGSEEN